MAIYKSKKPTKDGRQYFFRIKYKDIMGITHDYTSQKFKSPKEARNEEALYRIKINNQETITSSLTIEQAYLELRNYKSPNIKKQTIVKNDNLFKYLAPIINKKINDIDLNVYNVLIEHLKKTNVSIDYKNKILGLFKQIIIYSSKYHNTSDSIVKFIDKFKNVGEIKKEMEFFTYDEYLKFISVIPDLEWKTFFSVLYFMGIRKGECQSLTWADIKFEKKEMRINKTLTTKIKGETYSISSPKTMNSIRTLPIPKNVLESLKTMKDKAKQYKDFKENWFVFGNTIPFKENTIQNKKIKYCNRAGVKQIRIHDFRHSCASLLINNGASIALVSKYLGHSKISITLDIYTHLYKNELEEITNLLNKL